MSTSVQELVSMYNENYDLDSIALQLKCSRSSVIGDLRLLKRFNLVKSRNRLWTMDEQTKLVTLYNLGTSWEDISNQLDRTVNACMQNFSTLRKKGFIDTDTIRKNYKIWNNEKKLLFIKLYNSGLSYEEMSNLLNISHHECNKRAQAFVKLNLVFPHVRKRNETENRFLDNIKIDTVHGHWLWMNRKNNGDMDYGRFCCTIGGKKKEIMAHRWSYMHWKNNYLPIKEGLVVRHMCHTPSYVNPKHLSIGTPKDNINDMIKSGRAAWQQ